MKKKLASVGAMLLGLVSKVYAMDIHPLYGVEPEPRGYVIKLVQLLIIPIGFVIGFITILNEKKSWKKRIISLIIIISIVVIYWLFWSMVIKFAGDVGGAY